MEEYISQLINDTPSFQHFCYELSKYVGLQSLTIFVIGGLNFTLANLFGVMIHYAIQNALIIVTLDQDREFTSLYHYNLLSIILWRALEIDCAGSFIILSKISII